MEDKEILTAAANMVANQLAELPLGAALAVDPDVADYMGAFEENAIAPDDMADDDQLTINDKGEVIYG